MSTLSLFVFVWIVVSFLIGGVMIVLGEWRRHSHGPKPDDVRAFADRLEAGHGEEALRVAGQAIERARMVGDFEEHTFLKAVVDELAGRALRRS